MRALKFITGHAIHNLAYTYKFQLKTALETENIWQSACCIEVMWYPRMLMEP